MNQIDLILTSVLSQRDITLSDVQTIAAREAIGLYAIHAVERYRSNEGKSVIIEAVKLIPSILKGEYKLALRKFFFNQAKKMAMMRSEVENRKIYCIRSSEIAYKVLSTKDVEMNKRLKIFGKSVDAIVLHEMADYVAYPRR